MKTTWSAFKGNWDAGRNGQTNGTHTELTFDVHVSKKANNMLGLIRRLSPTRVWSGRMKRSQIRVIEKIQMPATEMIEG